MNRTSSIVRRAYAATTNGQFHYAHAGDGRTLLLLGESPRTHRAFDRLLPLLAARVHAIALDLPGYGNSHPLPDPVSVPAVADQLVDLLDALEIETVSVFGMHTGNKIAAALAADHPDRVDRLVLAGQTHSLFPGREERNAALAPSFEHYHPPAPGVQDNRSPSMRDWLNAKLTLDDTWWPGPILTGESDDPALIATAEAKSIDLLLGWRSAIPMYHAIFAFDLAEAVSRIVASTLVLEFATPQEAHLGLQAGHLAALMKHATTTSIPVTFLAALEDQPEQVADAVLSFVLRARLDGVSS